MMSAFRYLMSLAYIGKPFRGSQRQVSGILPRIDDPSTVQGRLEMGLKTLKLANEPIVTMSCRTDAGVHAINTTCQVDLIRNYETSYPNKVITTSLNNYFKKQDVPIRILKTYLVPETFNCRHKAISRTYLYRLTIGKTDATNSNLNYQYIPIEEWGRTFFLCTDTFDLDKMKEGAKLFKGYHDFRSFMGKSQKREPYKITRRIMDSIDIQKAEKTGYSSFSWPFIAYSGNDYLFLNIYIKSSGFLYKQVRRTVAALVALAQGKITIRDLKLMLEIPSRHSWQSQIKTLPAYGLYLCDVKYAKEDLDTFKEEPETGSKF